MRARYNSGVALLKVVIRKHHLDTNATTSNQIRTKLSTPDTYIATTIDSKYGKFNQYVKLMIQFGPADQSSLQRI